MTLVSEEMGGLPRPVGPPALLLEYEPGTHLTDEALGALAYACAFRSVQRHADGHVRAMDMPVGAVVYDQAAGRVYGAFARDQEMGGDDTSFHAEPLAVRYATTDGSTPDGLVVATTLEPCLPCLDSLGPVGRVLYLTPRAVIENLGLVHRRKSAPEVAAASAPGSCCRLERLEDPYLGVASDALFTYVTRDPETRAVTYRPGQHGRPTPIDIGLYVPHHLRRPATK